MITCLALRTERLSIFSLVFFCEAIKRDANFPSQTDHEGIFLFRVLCLRSQFSGVFLFATTVVCFLFSLLLIEEFETLEKNRQSEQSFEVTSREDIEKPIRFGCFTEVLQTCRSHVYPLLNRLMISQLEIVYGRFFQFWLIFLIQS